MISIKSRVISPPEILKRDVECFSVFEYSGSQGIAVHVSPQAAPGIVFQHQNGHSALESINTKAGATPPAPTLFLYGPGVETSVMNFSRGSYTSVQAVLKPHALNTLMGIDASACSEGFIELNELATYDLNVQLLNAKNINEQITELSSFLISQLQRSFARDLVVEESLYIIQNEIANVSVRYLLERLKISERQFQRRFGQTVGISPQSYIRVKRFNEAVKLIKSGRYRTLTEVTYALNYYDQSHLIRDFRAFSGVSPKTVASEEDDFYHAQTGYSYI